MSFLSTVSKSISIDGAILLLRLWLGSMMMYHGFPKVFTNSAGFVAYLEKLGMPMPSVMAALAAGAEFFGGMLIAIGLLTRPAVQMVSRNKNYHSPTPCSRLPCFYQAPERSA
jgi:hypothetical protein